MNYITGEKFIALADYVFAGVNRMKDDYCGLKNNIDWVTIKNNALVYTHTGYVKELFEELRKHPNKYIYLISHNSDVNVNESFDVPQNVVKWYTQNVDVENARVISIPIGLENEKWFPHLVKKDNMQYIIDTPRRVKNLMYMNHNISTNVNERFKLYQMFENKPWVTSERGKNGAGFMEYITNIYSHRFVLCPPGNGIDTHRTWETLYMGSFPVEKRNKNNRFYSTLPICFVDDWDEINERFLACEYKRLSQMEWDRSKLSFEYWKSKITRHEG